MKSSTECPAFDIPSKMAFANITAQVQEVVRESRVAEGFVPRDRMHVAGGVFVNDDEAGLHHDFGVWLTKLAPPAPTRPITATARGRTTPTPT
jgi:thiamine phosphate synthase YjbQ (UPF0047 family)